MHPGSLAVMLLFGFPIIVVAGFFIIWALKIVKGDATEKNERLKAEETRLIQELHQGLSRMEKRVEALETILLDPGKDSENEQAGL
jgi:phage shock protein B